MFNEEKCKKEALTEILETTKLFTNTLDGYFLSASDTQDNVVKGAASVLVGNIGTARYHQCMTLTNSSNRSSR